ncbi:MAG: S-layer homology domain-containing protein [Acidimicrobiia bacterium]|nr:S-layer homology domain-containing protein [Acidimicrobiia bacterium]
MTRSRAPQWICLALAVALVVGPGSASAAWPGENGRLVAESIDGIYVWEIGSWRAVWLADGEWPKWSPDGSEIAFGADGDIWVMNADGSNKRNLTGGVGWTNHHPTWSPDGSMIAFGAIRDPFTNIWVDGDYNIWVMDADGSGQLQLTDRPGWEHRPMWSPDGSKIAFVTGQDSLQIWVMDVDGGNQRQLTAEPGYAAHGASWSPDGSRIAYTRYEDVMEGEPGDVFVMDADGGNKRNLTNHPAADGFPVWSPDGHTILFWSNRVGEGGIWSMNADGTGAAPVDVPAQLQYTQWFDWERVRNAHFDDVPGTHTFFGDVEWLAGEGITKGCNPPFNTMFCAQDPVTRGQMAAFLVRALSLSDDGGGDLFTDDDGSVFEPAIDKLATAGITQGCNPPEDTMFCPNDHVTRGQMAAFLHRALG